MSKKKAFSGNTMTLKDFHGGSIPTDLPLPSAPGGVVRPTDRSGYDRATSWGNPIGRSDHRNRPNSSPAIRHFDDRTPFLTHTAHIGRNFDEDERKPLDGGSAPRRIVSDESFRVPAGPVELKPESLYAGRGSSGNGSAPVLPIAGGDVNSYSGRVTGANQIGVSSQNFVGNASQAVSGLYPIPNAWTARKEVVMGATEQVQSAWSEQSTASKLAHAGALEKVSSGRWQSKQSVHYQTDAEVIKYSEENSLLSKGYDDNRYNEMDAVGGREYSDTMLARDVDRSLSIVDWMQVGRKESLNYERSHDPSYLEVKERNLAVHGEGAEPGHLDGNFGGSEVQPLVPSEVSDRPKLKLLPRTKPLDNIESPIIDPKQAQQRLSDSALSHAEAGNNLHGNINPAKPDSSGSENVNQTVERPKLNLKPRSEPVEQLEGNFEKERNALFGGARPREMVLKERGVGDVSFSNRELGQRNDRVKHDDPRAEKVPEQVAVSQRGEKTEKLPYEQGTGRKFNRNHQVDVERTDMPRRNWRNDNRKNGRETERQQQQERPPSPETWRKPVEEPKPSSSDTTGLRYGKAASAAELAQAFSKSKSESDDRYCGSKGLPSRTQMPFSRLIGPTPRPQVNGY
ncbi:hypothetical protein SLEP1_g29503 [Rubroshorea leprosula]|uniref:Eukaryotic translation initiation factor-related n=1 Tax=Rubroshorea leprosula TaxID=152421 RepID=A0AAV5K7R2_9ROSI|nr:hypothetical protein SLEP1_g29503 [Rubroshorea leprosula]